MVRTHGAKDIGKRTRRQASGSELSKRADKREAKAAAKKASERKVAAAARATFFDQVRQAPAHGGTSAAADGDDRNSAGGGSSDDPEGERAASDAGDDAGGMDDEGPSAADPSAADPPRRNVRPDDVQADLDEDDQLGDAAAEPGVMGEYLKAVFDRLHSEVCGAASRSPLEPKWLVALLNAPGADWWLRAGQAHHVCGKLGLEFHEPSYYRDVNVWLPDVRWGQEAMPPCVECESAEEVGPLGFRDNHFARRICALKTHYFTMSRRYVCRCCERKAKQAAAEAKQAAEDARLSVEECEDECEDNSQYTFMGWDGRSRARLPFGYGDEFPAFLTYRAGVDVDIIDLMR